MRPEAPKKYAATTSRTRPSTRESAVASEKTSVDTASRRPAAAAGGAGTAAAAGSAASPGPGVRALTARSRYAAPRPVERALWYDAAARACGRFRANGQHQTAKEADPHRGGGAA